MKEEHIDLDVVDEGQEGNARAGALAGAGHGGRTHRHHRTGHEHLLAAAAAAAAAGDDAAGAGLRSLRRVRTRRSLRARK